MGRAIESFAFDSATPYDDRRVSIDSSPSSAESTFRELDDVFLQTQARIWLGEVLHTRLDEETPIADLLADGKLLFQVSKVIWEMLLTKCVKLRYSKAYFTESKASGKSSWKYMAYSNVDSFLKVCKILGLTSIDLFSSSDVVEKRDVRRVCMCIRSFSMKARSKDLNVPDFDVVTYTVAMPTDMVGCIRRSLEKSGDRYSKSSGCSNSYNGGKPRNRQRSWDVGYVKYYDSYSEESEDPGSNYRAYSSSSSTSYDDASLLISDVENSPDGSLVAVENLISTCSTLQSIVQDQEKGGHNSSQYEPTSLAEVECSPSTYSLSNDNHKVLKVPPDCVSSPFLICESEGASFVNDGAATTAVSDPGNGIMMFSTVDPYHGPGTSSVEDFTNNHNKSERNYIAYQSGTSYLVSHGTNNNDETSYAYGPRKGGVTDSDTRATFPMLSSTKKVMGYQLERRASDNNEFAITHFTANQNSVSSRVDTVDYEDKFEAHDDSSSPCILLTQVQDLDSVYTDMSSMSGYESEDMVKYGVFIDSSTSDIDKLLSGMKSEDVDSTKYLPTVECQMSKISKDVTPLSSCSKYVHNSPISFSKDTQWISGSTPNDAYDVEAPFNVVCSVPAIKGGEKYSNCAMIGSDPKHFSSKDTSQWSCVRCGNASEEIIIQQCFIGGHPTSCYKNSCSANNLVQDQAMSHSILDIPEDKYVLPFSVNIQSAESGCLVLDHPNSHSRCASSVKTLVKYPVTLESGIDISEEKTMPPLSANIEFTESDCLLSDHLVGETEKKAQLDDGSVGYSVDHSGVLECANVLDIDGRMPEMYNLSDPDHSVNHDEAGTRFLSMSAKVDESGNPSSSLENDNKEAHTCQQPVAKNVLHATPQGFTDQESVGNVEKDKEKHEKVEKCLGAKEPKSHKGVLMKSVAGGVTLVGVFFFLFNHRRKSGKDNADETSPLSIQVRKDSQAELSKLNGQKKGRVNGVFPGDKLRFQD